MVAVKGLEILVKRGDGGTPQTFTTIAGLRSKSVQLNKEIVDITSVDNTTRWRELLAGASVRSLSVSGSGVLKTDAVVKNLYADAIADTFRDYQVVVTGIGTFEGPFQVTVNLAGDHGAEATYDISLESAGEIEFDAE